MTGENIDPGLRGRWDSLRLPTQSRVTEGEEEEEEEGGDVWGGENQEETVEAR